VERFVAAEETRILTLDAILAREASNQERVPE
jgi:hypothetical protein